MYFIVACGFSHAGPFQIIGVRGAFCLRLIFLFRPVSVDQISSIRWHGEMPMAASLSPTCCDELYVVLSTLSESSSRGFQTSWDLT